MTIEQLFGSVVLLRNQKDLNELVKQVSKAFSIKQSRARERVAEALNLSSCNALVASIKKKQSVAKSLDEFLNGLLLAVSDSHPEKDFESLSKSISELKPQITSSSSALFAECKFKDFMEFALYQSEQRVPKCGFENAWWSEHDDDSGEDILRRYWELDNALVLYLCTGEMNEALAYGIDFFLNYQRKKMLRASCEYWEYSGGNNRFVKKELLISYRDAVMHIGSPKIVHNYVMALYFVDASTFCNSDFRLKNYRSSINDNEDLFIGRSAFDSRKYFEDIEDGFTPFYPHPFTAYRFEFAKRSSEEGSVSVSGRFQISDREDEYDFMMHHVLTPTGNEGVLYVSNESSVDPEYKLPSVPGGIFHRLGPDYGYIDYQDDERPMKVAMLPIVKIGNPLTSAALKALREDLAPALKTVGRTWSYASEIVDEDSLLLDFYSDEAFSQGTKLTGSAIADFLKKNTNSELEWLSPDKGDYLCFSARGIYRPTGLDDNLLSYVLGRHVCEHEHGDALAKMPDIINSIASGLGYSPTLYNTLTDNLVKMDSFGVTDEGECLYFEAHDGGGVEICPEHEIFPAAQKLIPAGEDVLEHINLSECHNVYVMNVDNDEDAMTHQHILGFDKGGNLVVNVVWYSHDTWAFNTTSDKIIANLYRGIQSQISGTLTTSCLEGLSHSDDGRSNLIACWTEQSLLEAHFGVTAKKKRMRITTSRKGKIFSDISNYRDVSFSRPLLNMGPNPVMDGETFWEPCGNVVLVDDISIEEDCMIANVVLKKYFDPEIPSCFEVDYFDRELKRELTVKFEEI